MREIFPMAVRAAGVGLMLVAVPAAAQPGQPAKPSGSVPSAGLVAADDGGDAVRKALFTEMQAEGLIAVRPVGWTAMPSPAPAARNPERSGPDTNSPFPPKGVRKPPCLSP